MLAACVTTAGLVSATSAAAATGGGAAYAAVPGSVAVAATSRAEVGQAAQTQQLTIHVWLKPNLAGAARYAEAVATPGSATFHHYLSPAAYTNRFGASADAATAVRNWLVKKGFTSVRTESQRSYVTATGSVSNVESSFRVQINEYRSASGQFQSNDRDISVPKSLAKDVLSVTGLNNSQPKPLHTKARMLPQAATADTSCSQYWAQRTQTVTPKFKGQTSYTKTNCGYTAAQLRAVYGMNTTNVGTGQRIALIEVGTPYEMFKTLTQYASVNGLPAPRSTQYQELVLGKGDQCGNPFDIEEQLDSEAAYTMAPDADQLLIGGDGCNFKLEGVQPLFDAQSVVLAGNGSAPLASIESNSWGLTGGETFPQVYQTTAHAIMLRAAAEGVTMIMSSGDDPGVQVPGNDPFALVVGGTTLGIGKTNQRVFETGWSNDDAVKFNDKWFNEGIGRDAAGGGRSLIFAEPAYQQGVVPAGMTHIGVGSNQADRVVPDLSAVADPNTGILQIITVQTQKGKDKFQSFVDGGTSLAAPLVAGELADAQQGQSSNFGFVNPALYSMSGTNAFSDALPITASTPAANRGAFCPASLCGLPSISVFDSELSSYTDQVTRTGYDTMTGLGTPHGQAFITALRAAMTAA
jgi:subtilase family serine protease